jgi:hypothetical protein
VVFGRSGTGTIDLTLLEVKRTSRDGAWVALGDVNGDGVDDLGANSIRFTPALSELKDVNGNDLIRHTVGEVFFGNTVRGSLSLNAPNLVIEPGRPNYDLPDSRNTLFNSPGRIDNSTGRPRWVAGPDYVLADSFGGFSRVYLGQALQNPQTGTSGGGVTVKTPEEFQFPVADPTSGPPPVNPPGLNLATSGPNPDLGDAVEIHGSKKDEHLSSARSAGDINGDGVGDLIVEGAKNSYVILGPANIAGRLDVATRANIIFDRSDATQLAQSMADFNGDGINDLVFFRSVPRGDPLGIYDLTIGIIFGGPDLPHRPTFADADRTVTFANGFSFISETAIPLERRTFTIAALNFNDDHLADLLIVPRAQVPTVLSAAYVISGRSILTDVDRVLRLGGVGESSPYLTVSNDFSDKYAVQLHLLGPRGAGYNAGTEDFLSHEFSVVVPGDVNGDGLDDFVMTDKGYAADNRSAPPIGRSYLFLGTRDFAVDRRSSRSLDNADRIYQGVFFGENAVATGDVNADGYADFAVSRSREGGANAPSSLLFFYGNPNIARAGTSSTPGLLADGAASQFLSRKTGDAGIGLIEAQLASTVFLDGALWATTGDFNGDGKLDLAVGEPKRTLRDPQDRVLDVQQRGQVLVYFSIADQAKGLFPAAADRVINGEGEFDQFGVLSPTGPIDLNRDRIADLLIGAPGADVLAPTLTPGAGKIYVVYDGVVAPTAPPGAAVTTLTNDTVTGDGDFVKDPGTNQPIIFPTPTTNFTIPIGQTENWYTFTTLGDGAPGSIIRLSNPARDRTTTLLRGADSSATASVLVTLPTDPIIRVDGTNDGDSMFGPPAVGEGVERMFDGFTQKYVNPQDLNSGAIITPRANNGNGTIVNGIRFYTANDAPERDPASYVLEGTNDDPTSPSAIWFIIQQGPLDGPDGLPTGRNTGGNIPVNPSTHFNKTIFFHHQNAYKSYRVKFPTVRNAATALAVQIGEVQLLSDSSTLRVGGPSASIGTFEFNISQWLPYVDQPNLLEKIELQLDYQNATLVAGQRLNVFIGRAKSDGVVSPADATAPTFSAGSYSILATDPSSGLIKIDITTAVRDALAAGRTRIMLRLASSSTQTSLDVHSTSVAQRQTRLVVTTAPQEGAMADLIDPAGNVLARRQSVISLRPFKAGQFFLRVYNPHGPATRALSYTIEMVVPAAGNSHADADRDEVSGGDGDDTVNGSGFLDRIYGNSGNDSFVGDDVEAIDRGTTEPRIDPDGDQSSNTRPIPEIDPVVTIADVGLRNVIADALGIGHTAAGTGLTRPFLASQLAQIRELDASGRQISDLTGLEQLFNLETLNLSRNNLTNLTAIASLTQLRILDLGFNRLTDANLGSLAGLTRLRSLNLDSNSLRSLAPLATLRSLTFLSVDGAASPLLLPGSVRGNDLLAKFYNPAPAVGDFMGNAVTKVGRFLAVADSSDDTLQPNAGAVYLYDGATGQLVRTLRGGAAFDQFGFALTSFGDILMVSAPFARFSSTTPNTGLVYFYEASTGKLLDVVAPPSGGGGEEFGASMAVLGQNLIVGAPGDNPFSTGAVGAAFRYDILTQDNLTQYFPASNAAVGDRFGASVAALGDRVFVGVPGFGANDNGMINVLDMQTRTILSTIANPEATASSGFGSSMTIIGDKLAVGARANNAGKGAVYIFDPALAGQPVRTLNNPAAVGTSDDFGVSLAAFDTGRLLIGAPFAQVGAIRPGAVYVMDVATGAVLQTVTNPTPTAGDQFGLSIAVVDGDLLIGAPGDRAPGQTFGFGGATLLKGPRISDVSPLAPMTNLTSISLGNNRISSAATFGSMTNLVNINLQSNQIASNITPFNTLTRLKTLALNRNPFDNSAHSTLATLNNRLTTGLSFDANAAPIITPIGPRATVAGAAPFTINLSAADADPIFFTGVTSSNPNVGVQLNGNVLTVTPPPAGNTFVGTARITLTAFDGPSGATDFRGRSGTSFFDVSVGLAAISGAKFADFNQNGVRDAGDNGIANWTFFLDTDDDNVLDVGERIAVTDSFGNYAFSGLTPGSYNVAEVLKPAWTPIAPRDAVKANFTGGAAQGFTVTGGPNTWGLSTRRATDPGHTADHSFYYGNPTTGSYENGTSGTLTSAMIDLRLLDSRTPVGFEFKHFLQAPSTSTPLSNADFELDGGIFSPSLDGYTATGAWHVSSARRNEPGHSLFFDAYFGSGESPTIRGTYAPSQSGALLSPLIDLTRAAGRIHLDLNYFLGTEGRNQIGTDDFAGINVINGGGARIRIASNDATAGGLSNTTEFTRLPLDLSAFRGQQIRLEFVFTADPDVSVGEGWIIDDVTVSDVTGDIATVGVLADNVFTPLLESTPRRGLPNNTTGFVPVSLDLSRFLGKQIQVQYRFAADAATTAEGWLVDDVKVHIGIPTTYSVVAGQAVPSVDFGGVQVAEAGSDMTVTAGTPVNLTGIVRDPDPTNGSNFTYSWRVTTNTGQVVPGASTENFSFTPTRAGTYVASFAVTDRDDNNRVYTHSITITVPLDADPNGDGKVDFADFQIVRDNFGGIGKTAAEGDLNGDAVVDFLDFQILERNFGKSLPTPAPGPAEGTAKDTAGEVLVPTTPAPTPQPRPKPAAVKRPARAAAPAPASTANQALAPSAKSASVPAVPAKTPAKTPARAPVLAAPVTTSMFSTKRLKTPELLV